MMQDCKAPDEMGLSSKVHEKSCKNKFSCLKEHNNHLIFKIIYCIQLFYFYFKKMYIYSASTLEIYMYTTTSVTV